MMTFIRAAIATVSLILIALFAYIFFYFDSNYELDLALNHFQKGEYPQASEILSSIEDPRIKGEKALYQAYIAREEGNFEASNRYLETAVKTTRYDTRNRLRLEIYLNQTLNAYLQNNLQAMNNSLKEAEALVGPTNEWIRFFSDIKESLKEQQPTDIEEIEEKNIENFTPLSLWMQKPFKRTFTPFWSLMYRARMLIAQGNYIAARQLLEQNSSSADEEKLRDIMMLMAISYIEETNKKNYQSATPYFKLAFSYLSRIPIQSKRYATEREKIISSINEKIGEILREQDYEAISFYVYALEQLQAKEALHTLSSQLMQRIEHEIKEENWEQVEELILVLNRLLPGGELRKSLAEQFTTLMNQAIVEGKLKQSEEFWKASQLFSDHPKELAKTYVKKLQALIEETLSTKPISYPTITTSLELWKTIEKNPEKRLAMARQILDTFHSSWTAQEKDQQLLTLLEQVKQLPDKEDQSAVNEEILITMKQLYEAALENKDYKALKEFVTIVKDLDLPLSAFSDPSMLAEQTKKAQYLYKNRAYKQAEAIATWLLSLDPDNQSVMQIQAMIDYLSGNYHKALDRLRGINNPDAHQTRTLAVLEILLGNKDKGLAWIKEHQAQANAVYEQLGIGELALKRPSKAIEWFEKVQPQTQESLLGLTIATLQEKKWMESIGYFLKLKAPYANLAEVKGLALQAYTQNNQQDKALYILRSIHEENRADIPPDNPSFQILNEKLLSQFTPEYSAAYFHRYVSKDLERALNHLNKISNPSAQTLIDKGELLLELNKPQQAKDALIAALAATPKQGAAFKLEGRAYLNLAKAYQSLGQYLEAYSLLKKYDAQFPQDKDHLPLYNDILRKVRLWDLALETYNKMQQEGLFTEAMELPFIETLIHLNKFDRANGRVETLARFERTSTYDKIRLAQSMFITQNLKTLRELLNSLPQQNEMNSDELIEMLNLYRIMGAYEDAFALIRNKGDEISKKATGLMALSLFYEQMSDNAHALRLAREALAKNARLESAREFIETHDRSPEYLESLQELIEISLNQGSENLSLHLTFAKVLIERAIEEIMQDRRNRSNSQLAKAASLLEGLKAEIPDIPEIHFLLGQIYFLLNNPDAALSAYKNAIKRDPSYVEALQFLALAYTDLNKVDEAEQALQQALHFAPNNGEAWQQLARLKIATGAKIDAISAIEKAIKFKPNKIQNYLALGKLQLDFNNPENAKIAFEKALILDSDNMEAIQMLLITLNDPNFIRSMKDQQEIKREQKSLIKKLEELDSEKANIMKRQLLIK